LGKLTVGDSISDSTSVELTLGKWVISAMAMSGKKSEFTALYISMNYAIERAIMTGVGKVLACHLLHLLCQSQVGKIQKVQPRRSL
jgi:hypothetical protein